MRTQLKWLNKMAWDNKMKSNIHEKAQELLKTRHAHPRTFTNSFIYAPYIVIKKERAKYKKHTHTHKGNDNNNHNGWKRRATVPMHDDVIINPIRIVLHIVFDMMRLCGNTKHISQPTTESKRLKCVCVAPRNSIYIQIWYDLVLYAGLSVSGLMIITIIIEWEYTIRSATLTIEMRSVAASFALPHIHHDPFCVFYFFVQIACARTVVEKWREMLIVLRYINDVCNSYIILILKQKIKLRFVSVAVVVVDISNRSTQ